MHNLLNPALEFWDSDNLDELMEKATSMKNTPLEIIDMQQLKCVATTDCKKSQKCNFEIQIIMNADDENFESYRCMGCYNIYHNQYPITTEMDYYGNTLQFCSFHCWRTWRNIHLSKK
jgi:hypothetical protein